MPLVISDVAFRYPSGPTLFEGLSFEVSAGECVAILGPSGRGKSTLLGLISGVLKPTQGTVELIDDANVRGLSNPRFGWVFQGSNMLPHRRVVDNVVLPLLAAGIPRRVAEQRALEALDRLGVGALAHQRAARLSGGEAQRAAVARALVWPCDALLADEPTANLDAANAAVVVAAISQEFSHLPVILVTHDVAVADVADRRIDLARYLTDDPHA